MPRAMMCVHLWAAIRLRYVALSVGSVALRANDRADFETFVKRGRKKHIVTHIGKGGLREAFTKRASLWKGGWREAFTKRASLFGS
jgi:hypothetical protein